MFKCSRESNYEANLEEKLKKQENNHFPFFCAWSYIVRLCNHAEPSRRRIVMSLHHEQSFSFLMTWKQVKIRKKSTFPCRIQNAIGKTPVHLKRFRLFTGVSQTLSNSVAGRLHHLPDCCVGHDAFIHWTNAHLGSFDQKRRVFVLFSERKGSSLHVQTVCERKMRLWIF